MRKYLLWIIIPTLAMVGYGVADRLLFDGYRGREITGEGFQAKFYSEPGAKDQPTVVVIGGGPGGDHWANLFAEQGVATLSLPYYRRAGLPDLMEEIPLEYVERAITWLGKQPEVNQDQIILMGASRNAELALVAASYLPDLVSGVIALAPSAVSWSNTVLPFNSDSLKASWTYRGRDVPYLAMRKITGGDSSQIKTLEYWLAGLDQVGRYEASIIPVENIQGPILLLSGQDDRVWPSAKMSDMIEQRLQAQGFAHEIENIQFEQAGHLISRSVATVDQDRAGHLEIEGKSYTFDPGGTIEGDKQAIIQVQAKILSFLRKFTS